MVQFYPHLQPLNVMVADSAFGTELSVYLLAYNLLRTVMWQAAPPKTSLSPELDSEVAEHQVAIGALHLSLQGTRQMFNRFVDFLSEGGSIAQERYRTLLGAIALA